MTPPPTASSAVQGAVSGLRGRPMQDARLAHDYWHIEWRLHDRSCLRCLNGAPCRDGDDLKDRADSAGLRLRRVKSYASREVPTTHAASTAEDSTEADRV